MPIEHLSYGALLTFLGLFITVAAAGYILGRIEKRKIYIAFLLFTIDVAFWQGLSFILYLSKPLVSPLPPGVTLHEFSNLTLYTMSQAEEAIAVMFRILSIFWLSIGFWFVNLVYSYLNRQRGVIFKLLLLGVFGMILTSLFTDLVVIRPVSWSWGVDELKGPLFAPFAFFGVAVPAIYAMILIIMRRSSLKDDIVRKQLLLLAISALVVLVVGMFTDVVLPQVFGITAVPGMAGPSGAIQALIILMAVIRYGLFSPGATEVASDLFSRVEESVIVLNSAGKVSEVNEFTRKFFGLGNSQVTDLRITDLIKGYNMESEYIDVSMPVTVGDEEKLLSLSQYPIEHRDRRMGTLIICRDVTQQKRAEEKLIKLSRRNEALLQAVPDMMFVLSKDGTYLDFSAHQDEELDISSDEIIGKNIRDSGFSRTQVRMILDSVRSALVTGDTQSLEYELETQAGEGTYEARIVPLREDQILAIVRNITERKQAEENLKRSRDQLRNLSIHIETVREEERALLAREIHDEMGQILTALIMDLAWMKKRLPEGQTIVNKKMRLWRLLLKIQSGRYRGFLQN